MSIPNLYIKKNLENWTGFLPNTIFKSNFRGKMIGDSCTDTSKLTFQKASFACEKQCQRWPNNQLVCTQNVSISIQWNYITLSQLTRNIWLSSHLISSSPLLLILAEKKVKSDTWFLDWQDKYYYFAVKLLKAILPNYEMWPTRLFEDLPIGHLLTFEVQVSS